jgi:hypothetical protein
LHPENQARQSEKNAIEKEIVFFFKGDTSNRINHIKGQNSFRGSPAPSMIP